MGKWRLVVWAVGMIGAAGALDAWLTRTPHNDSLVAILGAAMLPLGALALELTVYRRAWAAQAAVVAFLPCAVIALPLALFAFPGSADGRALLSFGITGLLAVLGPLAVFLTAGLAARLSDPARLGRTLVTALGLLCVLALYHLGLVLDQPFLDDVSFFVFLAATPFAVLILCGVVRDRAWARWVSAVLLLPAMLLFLGLSVEDDFGWESLSFRAAFLLLLISIGLLIIQARSLAGGPSPER